MANLEQVIEHAFEHRAQGFSNRAEVEAAIAAMQPSELIPNWIDAFRALAGFDREGYLDAIGRAVEIGDFVKRGDPIATFVDNRKIIVSADLSEFDASYVAVGNAAEAQLATGERVRGTIRYVAPVADSATRAFTVELEVDNQAGALRAGGTLDAAIHSAKDLPDTLRPATSRFLDPFATRLRSGMW